MEDEKTVLQETRRFSGIGFSLTAIRIWQWISSLFVYASFSVLYHHIQRNRLGENGRMKGVAFLGLGSFVYSTVVICSVHISKAWGLRKWHVFAIASLPGDLTMMGLGLIQITILSYSGLPADCHGLTRHNYGAGDLVRQPAGGYSTIRFGSWSTATTGELDRLCTLPRTVYGLSVVAM
ncbi:hypothetical protein M406DRAFT_74829 [Cryphonectria parasitica EP155]|uniref:Uncharacterized protein n=1 Tax=Cryphonectria parasitica (strain ATCC 38755 / EP155) TaxID=660469 RepID=A0A9P4XV84_CRYP1|nr:uncharacterized protein M406DRAFT_74829 [Cryphonectria parasitica EP155]KAF3761904.1 hypothetical protein M406DRAFT_74829 [Cryphonectria parasitica EP155]